MMSRAAFRQNIIEAFGSDELVTLCADLGIDPDLIPGRDKGEAYWVDQLITYFERRNNIPALVSKLRAERPNIDWAYAEPAPVISPNIAPAGSAIPITWLVAAAGLAVLIVFAIVMVPKLGSGAAVPQTQATISSASTAIVPTEAATSPSPTTITTNSPATDAATTTPPAPTEAEPMPATSFNILFLDFGQLDSSGVTPSTDGARLSLNSAEAFKKYLAAALPAEVQLDFPPLVWHSRDAAQRGWPVRPIATLTDAQQIAAQMGAQMVVYGNFAARTDPNTPNGQLDVGFYVARAANTADEVVGAYPLSAPIPVRWPMTPDIEKAAQLELNVRNQLLSRFALGLAYDLFGRPDQALTLFEAADAKLPANYKAGREVLYFFIAREHLLLQQPDQAKVFHQKALAVNPNYARAHLGLGDVNLQYAAAITDPTQLLQSDALRVAGEQYTLAEAQALLLPDTPQLRSLAWLGLGLVRQIQGSARYQLGQNEDAQTLIAQSLWLLDPALADLKQRPDGQRRTLALGYLGQAEANWTNARLTGDTATEIQRRNAFYLAANEAYAACMALDVGTDLFLTENLVSACQRNQTRMSAEMPE